MKASHRMPPPLSGCEGRATTCARGGFIIPLIAATAVPSLAVEGYTPLRRPTIR